MIKKGSKVYFFGTGIGSSGIIVATHFVHPQTIWASFSAL
jgi:hypothetical protein